MCALVRTYLVDSGRCDKDSDHGVDHKDDEPCHHERLVPTREGESRRPGRVSVTAVRALPNHERRADKRIRVRAFLGEVFFSLLAVRTSKGSSVSIAAAAHPNLQKKNSNKKR